MWHSENQVKPIAGATDDEIKQIAADGKAELEKGRSQQEVKYFIQEASRVLAERIAARNKSA